MNHQRDFRAAVVVFAVALLIATAVSLRAQPRVAVLGTPVTVTGPAPEAVMIQPGITVDLRKLPVLTPGEFRAHASMPLRVPNPAAWNRQTQASEVSLTPLAPALPQTVISAPTVGASFAGIYQSDSDCNCEPPDTNLAAGPDQVVEVVNLAIQIFDKSGNLVQGPTYLNTFFGLNTTLFTSDPKVRYDPGSQRWFISLLSLNNTTAGNSTAGQIDLAVSNGPDLSTANWKVYSFPTPSELPDQPDMGFSADKLVLTDDAFSCNSKTAGGCNSGGWIGNEIFVVNKSDLTSWAAASSDHYGPGYDGTSFFSIQPARMMPGNSPQPTTLYMATVAPDNSSSIRVYTVTGLPGSPTPSSINATSLALSPSLIDPPRAQQPSGYLSTSFTGDNRLQDAVWQDGSLWVSANATCTPSGDTSSRPCLRYIEILTDTGSGLALNQNFNLGVSGMSLYYPAIALDQSDNLVSVFSGSSPSVNPSVYFASRLESDPLNTISAPVLVQAGYTSYSSSNARWGDYSGASIDPSNGTNVWIGGEYATSGASPNWGTWIAQVTAGNSGGPTPTATASGTPSATPTATPTATPSATPTATPVPPPSSAGKLRVSTHKLRFGKASLGASTTRTLKIKNKGQGPLSVSLADPEGPFTIVGGPTSLTVAAKQKVYVTVQFAPASAGKVTGTLSLTSSDPKHPSLSISLIGKGVGS